MGLVKGGFLRLLQTALYFLAFCCGAIILGFYSYFLSVLADRDVYINKTNQAIEGISGAAVLYTIFAVILTCCLGGVTFFAFLGLVLDILFVGGFIALAVLTRDGAHSCSGYINTPLGYGPAEYGLGWDAPNGRDQITYSVKFRTACRFNKACFAVSIIGAFIFIFTALMQVALARHHKKEKAYGPSPSNNYTSGFGKKKGSLFARNKKTKDVEYAAAGGLAAPHAVDTRPSHDTGYTGTTVGGTAINNDKTAAPAALPTHGGYHTAPQGTGVNPYGYTNTTPATNY